MTQTMAFSLTVVGVLVVLLGLLRLRHVSLQGLVFGLLGAITGLLIGALASVPLSKLPQPIGSVLPLAVTLTITFAMMAIMLARRSALLAIMPFLDVASAPTSAKSSPATTDEPAQATPQLPQILVDTSAIIDGRIADVATAGFMPGRLAVPRFVLAELQNIADSDDAMRRGRGRRGLDVLQTLRDMPGLEVTIIEDDVQGVKEVDAKLVALAQRFSCNVLTTDYNLNRVAQIQGVRVLNVNELSNAIRPVVIPGEQLIVKVVQPGKERNQGVGYLADGTMIVVENGDKLIGQDVATEVTRVFQTVAGKMIFAVPRGGQPTERPSAAKDPSTPTPKKIEDEAASAATGASGAEPESTGAASGRRNRFGRGRGAKRPVADAATSSESSAKAQSAQASRAPQSQNIDRRAQTAGDGTQRGQRGSNGSNSRPVGGGSILSLEDRIVAATTAPAEAHQEPKA